MCVCVCRRKRETKQERREKREREEERETNYREGPQVFLTLSPSTFDTGITANLARLSEPSLTSILSSSPRTLMPHNPLTPSVFGTVTEKTRQRLIQRDGQVLSSSFQASHHDRGEYVCHAVP